MSNQGAGAQGMGPRWLLGVQRRSDVSLSEPPLAGSSLRVQLGIRLTRSAPLALEEFLHLESCLGV